MRFVLFTVAAWSCIGCVRGSDEFRPLIAPGPAQAGPATVAPREAAACDVRMFIEQLPSAGRSEGISPGKVGVIAAEQVIGTEVIDGKPKTVVKLINGVCIKRPGKPLELPASITVATADDGPSLRRFCGDERLRYYLDIPKQGNSGQDKTVQVDGCTWNGVFHSARPFTITLLTDSSHSVGEYVDYLRVYRNGDLMAAWNRVSDGLNPSRVAISGDSLVSGVFATSHPPHLAPLDIRVIPRDDSVTRQVDLDTRNDHTRFTGMLKTAFTAVGYDVFPAGSPERLSFECLQTMLKNDARKIMQVVNGEVALDPPCNVDLGAGAPVPNPQAPPSLSDLYAEQKNQTRAQLNSLRAKAYADIQSVKTTVLADISKHNAAFAKLLQAKLTALASQPVSPGSQTTLAAACVAQLIEHVPNTSCTLAAATAAGIPAVAEYNRLVKVAGILDQDVEAVLGTVDQARALADSLSDKAKEIGGSPAKQAEVFNAFAQSIAAQGDPFEPRRDNPPLLAGEQKLSAQYSDKFQWFMLAPWNGVPLNYKTAEADFSAAVAVPFLDVVGGRYQWGKSRFADARFGLGVGYVQTEVPNTDAKQSAALPNFSLGFGTLKVGVGIVTGSNLGTAGDRLRFIVGADLYKLISGSNVEAL